MKVGSLMRFKVAFKVVEINKVFKVDLLQSIVVWPPFFEVRPPTDDTFYEGSGTEPISDLSKQYKNKSARKFIIEKFYWNISTVGKFRVFFFCIWVVTTRHFKCLVPFHLIKTLFD